MICSTSFEIEESRLILHSDISLELLVEENKGEKEKIKENKKMTIIKKKEI